LRSARLFWHPAKTSRMSRLRRNKRRVVIAVLFFD
jgi:hypothetical protein